MLPGYEFLPKLCQNSNGIDLPLQENIVIKPGETATVGLKVKLQIPENYCGLLMNRSSALPKHKIRVTLGLIDTAYQNEIKVVLENITKTKITLKAGIALCQFLLLPSKVPRLRPKPLNNKINNRGSFGSTGNDFEKRTKRVLNKKPAKIKLHQIENSDNGKNKINLIEMAEKANISATSFMLTVGSQSKKEPKKTFQCFEISSPIRKGLERKIYFPIFINKYRVIACVDSGSDVTLMQESLFRKIFHKQSLSKSKILTIKTFSNNDICVLGEISSYVKFSTTGAVINLCILVIKDIGEIIPYFLFGNDSLKATMATLAYSGDKQDPTPELVINSPEKHIAKIYYCSPEEIFTAEANYSLSPYEVANLEFRLHSAAPVVRTQEVILESDTWQNVHVMASKSGLEFDQKLDGYVATACVTNLTGKHVRGIIKARVEQVNQYKSIPILDKNRELLRKTFKKHPLRRRILPSDVNNEISVPLITVCNLQLNNHRVNSNEEIASYEKVSYTGTAEITSQIIDTGLEIPTLIYDCPEKALDLTLFDPEIRPLLKELFLEKYPNVIALHALDAGDVSRTLGYTALRLIPGESLPRHRRIYQMSPNDVRYMEELLEQFIRFNYVIRAPVESNDLHLYGMSTYMVPRKKQTEIPRLVIDFSPLTTIIQSPPNLVPDINRAIQHLQGKALFSAMDLKYAYLALKIDEPSRPLTQFLTPNGAYQWLSIPTGAACSPAFFIDAINKILHYTPVIGPDGQPIYETENKVKLKRDILPQSFHYFDDIICGSEPKKTYEETLKYHFKCLERIVERLAFHNVKLSINKSEFAKSKILFLGWIISHDFITPDPRRMEKIRKAEFPHTKKEMRSFIGLINSIRRVTTLNVIKEIQVLTPLTSSKKEVVFDPKKAHFDAFNKIKEMLLSEPLFCNLIREDATKYLWVDAASSSGCLGAVLAQRVEGTENEKYIPTSIDLENKVHRLIYDQELPYEECRLQTTLPVEPLKPSLEKTLPPKHSPYDPLHGFTEENKNDSLIWSVISAFRVYGCKIPDTISELREIAVKEIKKGILGIKLKDQSFNNNHSAYREYLSDFEKGKAQVDKDLLLAQGLAKAIHRCFIFLSTLEEHRDQPIFRFNAESTKPPVIFGLYRVNDDLIFTPYFYNKNLEFSIDSLKGKIEIIAYMAKSVPEQFKSRSILDLEAFAILTALHSLQRYISNTVCHLLTDSRVLYYLFHQKIGDSSTKIRRWVLKLISDYPLLKIHFIRTTENLADYLTRQGLPAGDLEKLNLKNIQVTDFYDKLPKPDFTFEEWATFCTNNPHYLTVNSPTINLLTLSLQQGISNLKNYLQPLDILKDRLDRGSFITKQKEEYAELYSNCLRSPDFKFVQNQETKQESVYLLENDLLFIIEKTPKILVPPSMVGILVSYTHLIGHIGLKKMLKNLENYSFSQKYSKVKKFVESCYSCFLSHGSSRKHILGEYPIPDYPFQEISIDLAESLNKVGGYSNLLVVQDVLSDYILIFPLKSKTANEVCRNFLFGVLQNFNVERIHSDNGPCFRNANWLKLLAAVKIKIINSSANNPAARGKAEKAVGTVKLLMKKLLAINSTYNWELLPYLVAKIMNQSLLPRIGMKPVEMVYGRTKLSESFLEKDILAPAHHSVLRRELEIEELTSGIERATELAKETLKEIRESKHDYENKNRIDKQFNEGDIVFVLDRFSLEGSTRPLKTKFYPSPFVVLQPHKATVLIKRLADGYKTLLSVEDIKKYKGPSPLFYEVPEEIQNVLLNKFSEMINSDFTMITTKDPLPLINIDNEGLFDAGNDSFSPKKGEGSVATPKLEIPEGNEVGNISESDEDDDDDAKILRNRKVQFPKEV